VGSQNFSGRINAIAEPAAIEAVVDLFRKKYGFARFDHWFGRGFRCFVLEPEDGTEAYYGRVQALFDAMSSAYDKMVVSNRLDRLLRDSSVRYLRRTFAAGDRLLEIGAGTGLETIPLAESGIQIVATDISSGMLEQLSRKAAMAGVSDRIAIRNIRASALDTLLEEYAPGSFDGAFSDFGALNCEPDWDGIPETLSQLVRPGGRVVLGLWNRVCLTEILAFGVALNPRRALARLRRPVPVGLSRFGVPVFALSPAEIEVRFSPYFVREDLLGLPVLLPPYDFERRLPQCGPLISIMESADSRVRGVFPFNHLGDHFLLRMRHA